MRGTADLARRKWPGLHSAYHHRLLSPHTAKPYHHAAIAAGAGLGTAPSIPTHEAGQDPSRDNLPLQLTSYRTSIRSVHGAGSYVLNTVLASRYAAMLRSGGMMTGRGRSRRSPDRLRNEAWAADSDRAHSRPPKQRPCPSSGRRPTAEPGSESAQRLALLANWGEDEPERVTRRSGTPLHRVTDRHLMSGVSGRYPQTEEYSSFRG